MRLIIELLWTLPAAGLMILMRKKFANLRDSAWAGPVGALVGALYAVALTFLVGPSIQALDVPFLPLTMTVGTAVGAAALSRETRPTFRRWSGAVCLLVILVTWTGFYVASASFARRESLRLIVIKLISDSQPLHWVQNGDSIPLNDAEKHAIEEATQSARSGALIPFSS